MPLITDKPTLNDAEMDRLSAFLAGAGPSAMNLEMLDGFITALISLPTMVMPSQYLPQIWGEDHEFDSSEQAQDIIGLIMRHWNGVADELQRGLKDPGHVYLPLLM